jgi:hypothetical protein
MSSFATAPSRTPDQESLAGKPQQTQLPVNPAPAPSWDAKPQTETPPAQAPVVAAGNGSQTIEEVQRVERLLAQLEARSMALVPYGYGNLREVPTPRRSNTPLLAGTLVAVWLTTMILGVAYIRYVGHSPFSTEREAAAPTVTIAPDPAPVAQKNSDSVDRLAQALVSSSERMNQLQAAVEKSNRDLQKMATKVNADHPAASSTTDAPENTSPVTAGTLPKNWHKVLDVKPTESAVAHKGADGVVDYWIIPRGVDTPPSKVLPIGTSADGVIIHNLDDGKDYTITPTGDWRNSSLASNGN